MTSSMTQYITRYLVILSFLSASSWALPSSTINLIKTTNLARQPVRPTNQVTTSRPSIQSQAPSPVGTEKDHNLNQPASRQHPSATITSSPKPIELFQGSEPPSHNWIERILEQVDSQINQDQQISGIDEQEELQQTADNISLVPTDSAEDPLERWPPVKSTAEEQPPARIVESENSVVVQPQPKVNQEMELTEERLVDSNNLSAIIANDHKPDLSSLSLEPDGDQVKATCEQAFAQCAWRKACARALAAYNEHCQDLIGNKTVQCSPKCLKAMIALRSSEEGDQLADCDCEGNEYCLQTKRQSQACSPQVDEALSPGVVVSCSTATWICLADQLCSTALDYYHRFCQSLFSQRHCSQRCNNSLSILNRQPKASKLITCQCDGSEEFPCLKYKTYTERLCLNKPPSVVSHQFFLEDHAPFSSRDILNQHRARRRDSGRFLAFTSTAPMIKPPMVVIVLAGVLLFTLQAFNSR